MISLKPIQTGDACYLQDHHNRPGECIITVTMTDGCNTPSLARQAILDALDESDRVPESRVDAAVVDALALWSTQMWLNAQGDLPPATDRDTCGEDEDRYLDCHILATWPDEGEC